MDFYAKLPSYFLHDIFLQSLVNRYGKQNSYVKKERSAVYIWNNIEGNKHYYSGSCTITCFPVFYSVIALTPTEAIKDYRPLIETLQTAILPVQK